MGINGLIVLRIIYPALRWLGWSVVLLYVVMALSVLGIRYVLLPKAEHYKPYLEEQLSALLGSRVELGHVSAHWNRLNPHVRMDQITLHDHHDTQVLNIPQLSAVLSWRSLFTWTPQFVSVHAGGVDLSVRRDGEGQLWLLGRTVTDDSDQAPPAADDGSETLGDRTVQWLVSQPQIRLYDSTIRWTDESRRSQPLILRDVDLKIRNRGSLHQFSLVARPVESVGGVFDMRGNFTRSSDLTRPLALESGQGQLYVHIDDMNPEAWTPWVDWPAFFHSDRVSVRTWLDVGQGEPIGITADVRARNAQWHPVDTGTLQSGRAHLHVTGSWPAFQNVMLAQRLLTPDMNARSGERSQTWQVKTGDLRHDPIEFSMRADDLVLSLPGVLERPVPPTALGMSGVARRQHTGVAVQLRDIALQNEDIAFSGSLTWAPGSGTTADYVDISAQVKRASLAAVHHYMPQSVSHEVREWLEKGLLAGQVRDAGVVIRGDPSKFPFAEHDSEGEFHIRGAYQDAVIDYIPPDEHSPGWPRLEGMQGWVELERASLRLHAATAQILPDGDASIQLADVDASIENLLDDAMLVVRGDTRADGSVYMALLQTSALNGMLNHVFDQTTAQGAWRLPLTLSVPLARGDDTQVDGTIHMEDSQIRFEPGTPPFDALNGQIRFTQDEVALESLSGRFLDGAVRLSGGIGPEHSGLSMAGQVGIPALRRFIDAPGMERFDGNGNYVATLKGVGRASDGKTTLTLTSDLQGIAMDFPPPLNKRPDEAWPLHMVWTHEDTDNARSLEVTLNHDMKARLERYGRSGASSEAYFDAGSLGIGRDAQWPEAGFNVDIAVPVFDGDAWDAITREFMSSPDPETQGPVLPDVVSLRVQTSHGRLLGLPLDELTYTVKQLTDTEWRADVSSTQTAGTLTWKQEGGAIQGPVQAVFHRLAYGEASEAGDGAEAPVQDDMSAPADRVIEDELRIPAINLIVENLSLYGRQVGKLALVGVNEERGHIWRLEQFALSSPSAHLEGRGTWRLRGPDRGLTLDAEVDVSDLGDYFDQIGFDDVLSDGEGMASMTIDWHDLPWSFDVEKIDGELSFEFTKGRLSTVNSKSARLLELISLQSIRRLATLDLNPLTLTENGFPYDVLRGALRLEHGKVHTEDYRITGPVGTIVLDGLVQMATGKLDLQAVVIPNLDVSGAAIAAGVAINPVIGIGAFLTQWLLKAPLAAAMTVQYQIGGDWDQPDIQAVQRLKGEAEGVAPQ